MKTLGKAAEFAAAVFFAVFIIWILASWADVLMHQFEGDPHAWNAFKLLVDGYYLTR